MARLTLLLAQNIATVRRAAGLRQRDLADLAGITLGYIEKIEQGRKAPTLEVLEALAWALGVDPARLVQELDVHGGRAKASTSGWTCPICGRDLDTVMRWRRRQGLPALQVNSVLCGRASCSREHWNRTRGDRLRYWCDRYERARGNPLPQPPKGSWRCAVCGIGWANAVAARQRRGLRSIDRERHRTCSPECRDKWRRMYFDALWQPRDRRPSR